jgi:hypothetical protein
MITGVHAIVYSKEAGKTRAFFRDVLGLRSVDAGRGWLIFALPPAELAAHPDLKGGTQQLYLMCDDVNKTIAELTKKGVRFTQPVADRGWGLLTAFDLPGVGEFWLYEPRHPMAIKAPGKARRRVKRPSARPRRKRK